jgi:hypothetical protein
MLDPVADPCRACGACCSYSSAWPRFTTDSDASIAAIPRGFVNENGTGMRCRGNRCVALAGEVGIATTCTTYAVRPDVCRACNPGDAECAIARRAFGLAELCESY